MDTIPQEIKFVYTNMTCPRFQTEFCGNLIIFGITKFVNPFFSYTEREKRGMDMRPRKLELGDRNLVGERVTQARLRLGMKQVELLAKLQTSGIDISTPALSLLEGQKRPVSDFELCALADALHVSVDWLLGREGDPS